jgi:hypothetical protein
MRIPIVVSKMLKKIVTFSCINRKKRMLPKKGISRLSGRPGMEKLKR